MIPVPNSISPPYTQILTLILTLPGPYSRFRVGACLLTISGEFIAGINIENVSYPVGVCAERCAMGTAVVSIFLLTNAIYCYLLRESADVVWCLGRGPPNIPRDRGGDGYQPASVAVWDVSAVVSSTFTISRSCLLDMLTAAFYYLACASFATRTFRCTCTARMAVVF